MQIPQRLRMLTCDPQESLRCTRRLPAPCSQSCNVRAYASQYLQEPSKALIDDVGK